jgi:hypothetical protein
MFGKKEKPVIESEKKGFRLPNYITLPLVSLIASFGLNTLPSFAATSNNNSTQNLGEKIKNELNKNENSYQENICVTTFAENPRYTKMTVDDVIGEIYEQVSDHYGPQVKALTLDLASNLSPSSSHKEIVNQLIKIINELNQGQLQISNFTDIIIQIIRKSAQLTPNEKEGLIAIVLKTTPHSCHINEVTSQILGNQTQPAYIPASMENDTQSLTLEINDKQMTFRVGDSVDVLNS